MLHLQEDCYKILESQWPPQLPVYGTHKYYPLFFHQKMSYCSTHEKETHQSFCHNTARKKKNGLLFREYDRTVIQQQEYWKIQYCPLSLSYHSNNIHRTLFRHVILKTSLLSKVYNFIWIYLCFLSIVSPGAVALQYITNNVYLGCFCRALTTSSFIKYFSLEIADSYLARSENFFSLLKNIGVIIILTK